MRWLPRSQAVSLYDRNGDMEDATYVQALERANLLSFYIENYLSGYHAQASVVAFGRGKENLDFLKKNDYEAYGCTLLTSELDVNYEKGGNVYRSAMQKQPNVFPENMTRTEIPCMEWRL